MSTPSIKHAIIVSHPNQRSFTAAVAERYAKTARMIGHEVVVRDLYRLGFNPVLKAEELPTLGPVALTHDVSRELSLLGGADVFVLVYPIWFGSPPAMLKGYIERVLGAGVSYSAMHDRERHPLLSGKKLVSLTSSGANRAWLEERAAWTSLRNLYDKYLQHAFQMESTHHYYFENVVPGLAPRFVAERLLKVEEAAREVCASFVHRPRHGAIAGTAQG